MSQELTGAGQAGGTGGTYLGTFDEVSHPAAADEGIQFDIPTGYLRYEIHIQNAFNLDSVDDRTLEIYFASVATSNVFGAITVDSVNSSGNFVTSGNALNLETEAFRSANNIAYLNVNNDGRVMGRDAHEKWNGIVTIVNPGSASDYCHFYWQASHTAEDGNHQYSYGAAVRKETSPINECLIRTNTADEIEATVHLYGWRDLS